MIAHIGARGADRAHFRRAAALVAAHEALHHLFQHERAGDLLMELDVEPVEQPAHLDALAGALRQEPALAEGEAARFNSVYDEYVKAPEVTRRRMYLETMEKVLGNVNKVILDGEGGQGVVPYLPLDQLRNTGTGGTNARGTATGGTN